MDDVISPATAVKMIARDTALLRRDAITPEDWAKTLGLAIEAVYRAGFEDCRKQAMQTVAEQRKMYGGGW